jgi:hypothetical protein
VVLLDGTFLILAGYVEVPDFLPEEWGGGLLPKPDAEEDDER